MRYKLLGKSGLRVSELSLGTMTFGEGWGFGASAEACREVFEVYTAAGGNFIDTANKYTEGHAEEIIGELVAGDRDRYVIGSKYTLTMRGGDPNAAGNHRKNLVRSVEASLRRLRTEHLDLLWVHAWDFTTGPAEVMRALDDLVRSGKILHVGVSDAPAWIVAQCNTLAELRGWSAFVGLQIEYSLIERTVERDLLPMAAAFDLGVLAWAPIGGGLLTGKYTRGPETPDSKRGSANASRMSEANLAIARAVDAVADEIGRPSIQVALNWVRQQGRSIIPIIGARKAAQLQDALGCLEFALSAEQLARLDEISRPSLGFPHDFLNVSYIQDVVLGDCRARIDLRR